MTCRLVRLTRLTPLLKPVGRRKLRGLSGWRDRNVVASARNRPKTIQVNVRAARNTGFHLGGLAESANALEYNRAYDMHKSFLERLVHKVNSKTAKQCRRQSDELLFNAVAGMWGSVATPNVSPRSTPIIRMMSLPQPGSQRRATD